MPYKLLGGLILLATVSDTAVIAVCVLVLALALLQYQYERDGNKVRFGPRNETRSKRKRRT